MAVPDSRNDRDRDMQRFEGTSDYVATDDLKVAVNVAVTLRRPLLVKGEPGTGKTVLAHEIAQAVGAPLIEWNIKSTTAERSEEHTSELQSLMRISYAVFCLQKNNSLHN